MTNNDNELERLRRELEALRSSFNEQIAGIEAQLVAISAPQEEPIDPWRESSPTPPKTRTEQTPDRVDPAKLRPKGTWDAMDKSDARVEERFRRYAVSVLVFVGAQLGPVAQLLGMGVDTYHHYRKQGRGAVFMMTAAGAIARGDRFCWGNVDGGALSHRRCRLLAKGLHKAETWRNDTRT